MQPRANTTFALAAGIAPSRSFSSIISIIISIPMGAGM